MVKTFENYRPLGPNQIRFVALQPRDLTDNVTCTLEYTALRTDDSDRLSQYEALSYTWGSPLELREISIDGQIYHVRENLYWALYYLRLEDKVRHIWVDALCINQTDIKERNSQVSHMDLIYKYASRVAVWLGPEQEEDAKALQYLHQIHSNGGLPKYFQEMPYDYEMGERVFDPVANEEWYRRYRSMWGPISKLCCRDYWTRVWIMQEVHFAAEITLYCGDYAIDWHIFSKVLYSVINIPYHGGPDEKDVRGMIRDGPAFAVYQQRLQHRSYAYEELDPLLVLMWNHQNSDCQELQDKIFGFRSLAADCCQAASPVEYEKPVHLLCTEAVEHFLQHQNRFEAEGMLQAIVHTQKILMGGIRSSVATEEFQTYVKSRKMKPFQIDGKGVDMVCYVSPSLGSLQGNYIEGILNGQVDLHLPRELVTWIKKTEDFRQKGAALNEIFNAQEAPSGRVFMKDPANLPLMFEQFEEAEEEMQKIWDVHETEEYKDILASVARLLRDAAEKCENLPETPTASSFLHHMV